MLIAVALMAITQIQPGPLDALRANLSATRVRLEAEKTVGTLAAREFAENRIWRGELGFVPDERFSVTGRYASDGAVEYFCFSSPGWHPSDSKRSTPKEAEEFQVPKQQLLFDGELTMRRRENAQLVDVMLTDDPAISQGIGPYMWDGVAPFPMILAKQFPNHQPKRFTTMKDGHPTEVETYYRDQVDGWHQLEVYYDVDAGYVPRFVRMVKSAKQQDLAFVRATYVTSIRGCTAGGFVPTEWFSVFFVVSGFEKKYPGYSHETELKPPGQFSVNRFRATSFADQQGAVRLEDGEGVAVLSSFGGQVSAKGLENRLTIASVRGALGMKLRSTAGPILPHVAVDELSTMTRPSRRWIPYALFAGLLLVVLAIWKARGRLAYLVPLSFFILGSSGCSTSSTPIINIVGSFSKSQIVYEPNTMIPLDVILKNDGNQPVRITQVDGGCTCRKVSQRLSGIQLLARNDLCLICYG